MTLSLYYSLFDIFYTFSLSYIWSTLAYTFKLAHPYINNRFFACNDKPLGGLEQHQTNPPRPTILLSQQKTTSISNKHFSSHQTTTKGPQRSRHPIPIGTVATCIVI